MANGARRPRCRRRSGTGRSGVWPWTPSTSWPDGVWCRRWWWPTPGYGQNADFRAGPSERGIDSAVAVRSDMSVHPHDAQPTVPTWSGNGRRPQPRYRHKPSSVATLAIGHGRQAFTEVTWRQGSRGPMCSHFLVVRVRAAGVRARRLAQAVAPAQEGCWGGVLPEVTLLVERPADA